MKSMNIEIGDLARSTTKNCRGIPDIWRITLPISNIYILHDLNDINKILYNAAEAYFDRLGGNDERSE